MQTGPSDTFVAHKAISLAEDLTGTEKRVAATIIDHFNRKTGRCDPALGSIARLLGVSRRTVIRAV
jgi:DNA-binding MurR/RpiR family transcriptional regulator